MRLEQRDSYLRRFTSRVRALERDEGGAWVALEASAFYPTSGGQPHDTGRLGDATVTDVTVTDGTVWHRLEGRAPDPGERVEGVIDWDRRYRHMQRHSAQHLLSQAFVRQAPAFETRSVSLRSADCTVDVAGEPDEDALVAVETLVNALAYRAMPIVSFEVDEREVRDYPLRRPPKVHGRIRLVAMGTVEVAACGGTHLANTAEALPIALLGVERVRGGLRRVTYRAGWDALEDSRAKHALTSALVQRFSAPLPELEARVERLEADAAEARSALRAERGERAALLADRLAQTATRRGDLDVVAAVVAPELLAALCDAFLARERVVALLAARDGERAQLSFVRGPGSSIDVRPALHAALAEVGGRGGGRPERAQGAGANVASLERALQAAVAALPPG